MKTISKALGIRLGLAAALSTVPILTSTPALARDHYHDGGNDAAIAIGAGILGLAVGAALADRDDRYYYDERRYATRRYVTVRGRPGYYYYYDGAPRRYYRDRYYDRYYAPYRRDHWRSDRGWYDGRRDWRRDDRRHYRGRDRWDDRRHDRHRDRHDHRRR